MGLTFGIGLLACTQLVGDDRWGQPGSLWNWGLLTALAGQFLLFLGLGLRWSTSRRAASKSLGTHRASRRRSPMQRREPAAAVPSPQLPQWSVRSEAVLGISLDAPERI
jgi:hypothetical protein